MPKQLQKRLWLRWEIIRQTNLPDACGSNLQKQPFQPLREVNTYWSFWLRALGNYGVRVTNYKPNL